MEKTTYLYLCDGKACDKACPNMGCHHTIDEAHAKNKIRRNRKFRMIKEKNGRITMWEVPNNVRV